MMTYRLPRIGLGKFCSIGQYIQSIKHAQLNVLCVTFLMLFSSSSWALRCGTDLVTKGDSRYDVLSKCGSPLLKEQWQELNTIERSDVHHSRIVTQALTIEEWTYNLGPAKFIQYLKFVDGKLVDITSGRRGFSGYISETKDYRCGKHIRRGDRKLDVLMRCGEPSFRDDNASASIISDVHRLDSQTQASQTQFKEIEEWVYDFGPRTFTLQVYFVHGKVVEVESGRYGR